MSDKITIGGKDYTIAELRRVAWRGDCNMHINALLDHIEAQQGERQAFVAGAEWRDGFCKINDMGTADICGRDDATSPETEAATRYPAARPQVTREMVRHAICENLEAERTFTDDCWVGGIDKTADAIMALIGGQ